MKKSEIISKALRDRQKKISDAAKYLDFKSENGMWAAVNNDTLNSSRILKLAELLDLDFVVLMRFLSDTEVRDLSTVSESPIIYGRSISSATDPHDLTGRIFHVKDELEEMLVEHRLRKSKADQ